MIIEKKVVKPNEEYFTKRAKIVKETPKELRYPRTRVVVEKEIQSGNKKTTEKALTKDQKEAWSRIQEDEEEG